MTLIGAWASWRVRRRSGRFQGGQGGQRGDQLCRRAVVAAEVEAGQQVGAAQRPAAGRVSRRGGGRLVRPQRDAGQRIEGGDLAVLNVPIMIGTEEESRSRPHVPP